MGSDPDELFSEHMMLEHIRRFGKVMMLNVAMTLPFIIFEKGDELDLGDLGLQYNDGNEISINSFTSEKLKLKLQKLLRDVIVDMVRLEYF